MKIIKSLAEELIVNKHFEDLTNDEFETLINRKIEWIFPDVAINDVEAVKILDVETVYDDEENPTVTITVEIDYQIRLK